MKRKTGKRQARHQRSGNASESAAGQVGTTASRNDTARKVARLSAVLIVRNEAEVLERTLSTLRPVADEIIVADTGSSDDTLAIARQHADQVIEIDWQNDFSVARNQAIAHATGDWVLSVDADEIIRQPDQARQRLLDFACAHPAGVFGRTRIVSATIHQGQTSTVSSHMQRFFPRLQGQFEGRIHEQLTGLDGPVRALDTGVVFDHSGYAHAPDDPQHKGHRNIPLLQAALALEPDNHYLHYQLGRAHFSLDQHGPAVEAFQTALSLICLKPGRTPTANGCAVTRETLTTTVVSLGYALINQELASQARAMLDKQAALDHPGTRWADFHHLLGYLGLMEGDIGAARRGYLESIRLGPACEDVQGCGSYASAYHLGLLAEAELDAPAATRHYTQSLAFKPDYLPTLNRYIDFCVENTFAFDLKLIDQCSTEAFLAACRSKRSMWTDSGTSQVVEVLDALLLHLQTTRPAFNPS